jgi:hypothetical protein
MPRWYIYIRRLFEEEDDDMEEEVDDSADLFDECFREQLKEDALLDQTVVEYRREEQEAESQRRREVETE